MPTDPPAPSGHAADSAMLAAIVETAGSVIIGLSPDHRIFAWNRAAEQLYQTSRDRAIGLDYVATFLVPEHQAAVAADIQQVLAGKRTLNFEDDSILPDGTRRTLIWNVSRVVDDVGLPIGIVATGQDITERKEAEERFRLVFENASDGLLISDASGVVDCNPAALEMLGLTDKSALVGRRPSEFSPERQPDGTLSDEKSRQLGALTLERGAYTFDWVHARRDGTELPVEVSVRHAMLGGRRVSVVAWRDQSRRRELERERAEVENRLSIAHKMEAVGQLAGGIAHDFNNLLATIRNSIELAAHDIPSDSPGATDLAVAVQGTESAARLTGQLLAFSRRQPRVTECIELGALVRNIVPLVRTSIPPDVALVVSTSDVEVCVTADRSQIEQVVLNLVLNARDAMPGGGTLTIGVSRDPVTGASMLTVSDTGIGMDDATRDRVFEPFFTTKSVGTGTGLGLAVVYGVVTQTGGTVRIDTAPGSGTRIEVALPPCAARTTGAAETPLATAPSSVTVLLVDDDDAVRSTTRRLLQRLKFTVREAADSAEALRLFDDERATLAVVLTDIRMPGMDGVQLATEIRSRVADFPIVFVSGYDAGGHESVTGLEDITLISKPFTAERLAATLQTAVGARRRSV